MCIEGKKSLSAQKPAQKAAACAINKKRKGDATEGKGAVTEEEAFLIVGCGEEEGPPAPKVETTQVKTEGGRRERTGVTTSPFLGAPGRKGFFLVCCHKDRSGSVGGG